jgi:hypothetical protein
MEVFWQWREYVTKYRLVSFICNELNEVPGDPGGIEQGQSAGLSRF